MKPKISKTILKKLVPHDQFAKACFKDKAVLTAFLDVHLEDAIKEICNLETVELVDTSFVDNALNGYVTDLLVKVYTKDGSSYMFIHIEFQSDICKPMPLRTFIYDTEIIKYDWLKKGGKSAKLVNVHTIVVYTGSRRYTGPTNIADMFEYPDLYTPVGTFQLVDLSQIADDELLNHGAVAIYEIASKKVRNKKFNQNSAKLIAKSLKISLDNGAPNRLMPMTFAYLVANLDENEVKLLEEEMKLIIPNFRRIIMSYEETLLNRGETRGRLQGLQEGKLQGLQEGKLQGLQEGKLQNSIENAINFLKMGIDPKIVAKGIHLPIKKVRKLEIELKNSHAKHTKH